jgi:hypothetical protein
MTRVFNFCAIFVFLILLVVSFTESSRCSKKCSFQELRLNSSIPSDFCPSSNESTNDIKQACKVKLTIDFTTGFVNGSFDEENQSSISKYNFDITTIFSLDDTSTKVEIIYLCAMFDYCDLEFMHEILWPVLAALRMESLRQELAIRLYNPNNTDPVKCFDNITCPQNVSLCNAKYMPADEVFPEEDYIWSECAAPNVKPKVLWKKYYIAKRRNPIDSLELNCNNPTCSLDGPLINTFQWLAREYKLPINVSMFEKTTTSKPTTTSSITTTPNNASFLFGHFNCLISFFLTILVLQLNFSEIF